SGRDGVLRVQGGLVERFLHEDGSPVVVRAWAEGSDVNVLAEAVDPALVVDPGALPSRLGGPNGRRQRAQATATVDPASGAQLERAVERMRFALGLDDDLRPFYERFRSDRLLGPPIRRKPWVRPRRRPCAWEALAWAVTEQLIEAKEAHAIQRRLVRRWGPRIEADLLPAPRSRRRPALLRDVPSAELIAGRAPAEIAALDLAPSRCVSLIRAAREVASGRSDLSDPASDQRLLSIPGIGPWTVQCLGLFGRGDPDALPAGDLAYLKLVGRLADLGRRATVEEVEEFFRPYAPYRGLAGSFALSGYYKRVAAGPPLKIAA
ncbi:MAG: DNA-3-methyladenine glycosylase family protein, partial [Solirubrobacterales bacterium]